MLIYITEPNDIDPRASALLTDAGHEVVVDRTQADTRAGEVEVLFVRTYTKVDTAMLDMFPQVRFVLRAGVGLDNIDLAACKTRGIKVINSPGANANAVAEYVVASLLTVMRRMGPQQRSLMQGSWRDRAYMGAELRGKVLGLVGCGNVARALVHKLSTWELGGVIGYDPYLTGEQLSASGITPTTLDEVLVGADVVSLHVPLVPETKHLLNTESLARMKRGSFLVNAARGGVVDEAALAQALTTGHLAGAVADVFEQEPEVPHVFDEVENILLTPHIGGYTHEADIEVSLMPARELLRQVSAHQTH